MIGADGYRLQTDMMASPRRIYGTDSGWLAVVVLQQALEPLAETNAPTGVLPGQAEHQLPQRLGHPRPADLLRLLARMVRKPSPGVMGMVFALPLRCWASDQEPRVLTLPQRLRARRARPRLRPTAA